MPRGAPTKPRPPLRDVIAEADTARAWQKLSVKQQREVIDFLCNVRILRGTPGARSLDSETIEVT